MSWSMITIKTALAILLLCDIVLGIQVYDHSRPSKVMLMEARSGVVAVNVTRLPFTVVDVWILVALVGTHVLLIYLAWRFRAL